MKIKKLIIKLRKLIYKLFFNISLISYKRNIYEIFKYCSPIALLDLGAAGDIEPRWEIVSKFIKYIGIEPDSRSREKLKKNHNFNDYKILNSFAWNQEENIKFNLCRKEQVSSAYEPKNLL